MELIKIFQQLKDDMLRELMHIITNTSESWTDIQMNHELTFMLSMYSFYFSIMSCSKPSEDVDLSSFQRLKFSQTQPLTSLPGIIKLINRRKSFFFNGLKTLPPNY